MEAAMRATWYVMECGGVADPAEVAPDADGVLRHADGRAVAMGPHGPRSRGVDVPDRREAPPARDRQMKATSGARYKTR
jgi:hypothetical protein